MILISLLALQASPAVKVEGGEATKIEKKTGYMQKCTAPLQVSVQGPGNLRVEVRTEVGAKGVGLQIVREEKFNSDNMLTLAKAKGKEKTFTQTSDINVAVPAGAQHYVFRCSETDKVVYIFEASKKAQKKNLAAAEKELTAAQQKEVMAVEPEPGAQTASTSGSSDMPPLMYLMPSRN